MLSCGLLRFRGVAVGDGLDELLVLAKPGELHLTRADDDVPQASPLCDGSDLVDGIENGEQAYFVHSFAAPITADTLATSVHGGRFTAVAGRGRCFGAQFHPERSADVGSRLLANFLSPNLSAAGGAP